MLIQCFNVIYVKIPAPCYQIHFLFGSDQKDQNMNPFFYQHSRDLSWSSFLVVSVRWDKTWLTVNTSSWVQHWDAADISCSFKQIGAETAAVMWTVVLWCCSELLWGWKCWVLRARCHLDLSYRGASQYIFVWTNMLLLADISVTACKFCYWSAEMLTLTQIGSLSILEEKLFCLRMGHIMLWRHWSLWTFLVWVLSP